MILKPSALKANPVKILDQALEHSQYVDLSGALFVSTKANSAHISKDDNLLSPWEQRGASLETCYDPAKGWCALHDAN